MGLQEKAVARSTRIRRCVLGFVSGKNSEQRFHFTQLISNLIFPQLSYSDGLDPLERTPRRRDPPTWLKENPDYEVEGDMLEVRSTL